MTEEIQEHPLIGTPCKRCGEGNSVIVSRKDNFCGPCFTKFLRNKQRKQMQDEKFKVKFVKSLEEAESKTPRILVPLSLGQSSVVLLDILLSQLEEHLQNTRAHPGYRLVVLVVDEEGLVEGVSDVESSIERIKQHYGSDLLEKLRIQFKVADADSYVKLGSLDEITVSPEFTAQLLECSDEKKNITFGEILSQFPTKTAREDFLAVIRNEVIYATAVVNDCSVVLFGDSMTRLADEILSLTVKGRGSEISRKLTDGQVERLGTSLHVIHPLRDVLQTEIAAYTHINQLDELVMAQSTEMSKKKSAKNKTINELVREYFERTEVSYPEVISTVVKIGSKLTHPQETDDFKQTTCAVCHSPVYSDAKRWLEQILVNNGAPLTTDEEKEIVEMYLKSVETGELPQPQHSHGETVSLCYGCTVNLGSGAISKGYQLPLRRATKEEILKEYVLTDDEDEYPANDERSESLASHE